MLVVPAAPESQLDGVGASPEANRDAVSGGTEETLPFLGASGKASLGQGSKPH